MSDVTFVAVLFYSVSIEERFRGNEGSGSDLASAVATAGRMRNVEEDEASHDWD